MGYGLRLATQTRAFPRFLVFLVPKLSLGMLRPAKLPFASDFDGHLPTY